MAELRSFQGLRYNPVKVPELGSVLAPPYDVISPVERAALLRLNPHNIVRAELALDNDAAAYDEAGKTLQTWLTEGVLVKEEKPACYLTRHTFRHMGRVLVRHEVTVALRIESLDSGMVLPHEDTRGEAKWDRLRLIRATGANISPVMLLHDGGEMSVPDNAPVQTVRLGEDEVLELWPVTSQETIARLQASLSGRPVYIADGHHRYETALRYRDESGAGRDDAAGYVMGTLIRFGDPGMVVLPYHRALGGLDAMTLAAFNERMLGLCTESRVRVGGASAEDVGRLAMEHLMTGDALFAVWGTAPDELSLFTLAGQQILDDLVQRGHSRAWSGLANSIFREGILYPILRVREEEAESRGILAFVKDAVEAVNAVNDGVRQMAVLCRPVPLDVLKEVSDRGERLPPKSTYFYPKLPTGLVLHSLVGSA